MNQISSTVDALLRLAELKREREENPFRLPEPPFMVYRWMIDNGLDLSMLPIIHFDSKMLEGEIVE